MFGILNRVINEWLVFDSMLENSAVGWMVVRWWWSDLRWLARRGVRNVAICSNVGARCLTLRLKAIDWYVKSVSLFHNYAILTYSSSPLLLSPRRGLHRLYHRVWMSLSLCGSAEGVDEDQLSRHWKRSINFNRTNRTNGIFREHVHSLVGSLLRSR